jgi:hypothetical protein
MAAERQSRRVPAAAPSARQVGDHRESDEVCLMAKGKEAKKEKKKPKKDAKPKAK